MAEENYASVAISVSIFDDYDFTGQLFTGDCDALTLVSNLGDFHIGSWSRVTPQLTPGQTYYVRIFSFGVSTNWNYSIRVNHLPSPANDLCENADLISLDDDGVTAVNVPSVTYATPSEGLTSTCSSNSVKDLWYRFSAP